MVTVDKDGTETKKLLEEIPYLPVPTIEETFNEFKKEKEKLLFYVWCYI